MVHAFKNRAVKTLAAIVLVLLIVVPAHSYSVLTHEQIVDLAWKDHIVPAIQHRFPNVTDEQLKEAHAYAYGGCLVQDMGYYPFGNHYFSDLVHYVRSGSFVEALFREATTVDEYAFALGALAHYASDTMGHPAVNRAVAIEFPKLRAKYGDVITYEDNKKAHIQTEFGFDVVQVAKNRYTSDAYHDFIGFAVAKESLARAFRDTYGIEIKDVFSDEDQTIGSFRWAISSVIPTMTKVALVTREKQMVKEYPTFNRKKFLYHLSRAQYERSWGKNYQRPGFGTRVLAFLVRLLPKIGPFKAAAIKDPTPQTEDLYLKSVNDSVELYGRLIDSISRGPVDLADKDFDTGQPTMPGEYRMTDETYAHLVHKLAERHYDLVTPALRDDVLQFFANPGAAPANPTAREGQPKFKRDPKRLADLEKELQGLRNASPAPQAEAER